MIRLAKHYEKGAKKYNRWNYLRGIPVSEFMNSALRHILQYMAGMDDEDHLSAVAFNILGALQMEQTMPDMCDMPSREGKESFRANPQG